MSSTEKSNPDPHRLVAYLRVSTEAQVTNGDSLDAQRIAIETWAADQDHEIVAVETDAGLSGTLDADARPGLTAALLEVADGRADGLVITTIDRLARQLHVQEAILAQVWAADGRVFEVRGEVLQDDADDPMRTALRQIQGVIAQLEASMVRTRLRQGRRRKAARGGYIGGKPCSPRYGHTLVRQDDGEQVWQPVPEQASVITSIINGRASGLTHRALADQLNAEGVAPPAGQRWHHSAVQRVLRHAERVAA